MIRHDLLSLSATDLADLSNRGTVNRARKELDQGKVSGELVDDEGSIVVTWSDGPTSTLPASRTLADAYCDCAAMGVCRHLVRAVLLYQATTVVEPSDESPVGGAWDPGSVSDEVLRGVFSTRQLEAFRQVFEAGLVVEVVRGTKPTARFHRLRHTVRFQVPDDVRYTQCDCSEGAPCRHAALAVWAFRLLGQPEAGTVTTGAKPAPISAAQVERVESAVCEVLRLGIAHTPRVTVDRLRAAGRALRDEGLVWPAEVVRELCREIELYHSHDARFSGERVAALLGELLIRFDAARNVEAPIPQLFVRGDVEDTETRLGQTRFIGLGCIVEQRERSAHVQALLQDDTTGTVAVVGTDFLDPAEEEGEPDDYSRLAAKLAVKGRALGTIGGGQLVVRTARLGANHSLSIGRSTANVYSQRYAWEDLLAPVRVEGLAEVRARLASLPPASLRPRRYGEDLHVVPLVGVRDVHFSSRDQEVRATLLDRSGDEALLAHPYRTRNRAGTERLLSWLSRSPDAVRFVAGICRQGAGGLVIAPTGVVFEVGEERVMVQPWVDDMDDLLETTTLGGELPKAPPTPIAAFRRDVAGALGDASILGIDEVDRATWRAFAMRAGELRLTALQARLSALSVGAGEEMEEFMRVAVLVRLFHELSG